jgi:hypothetical protein
MLSRNKEVLQSTTNADIQLALIGISNPEPSILISENADCVLVKVELPRLAVMAGGSQNCIPEQERQFFSLT